MWRRFSERFEKVSRCFSGFLEVAGVSRGFSRIEEESTTILGRVAERFLKSVSGHVSGGYSGV